VTGRDGRHRVDQGLALDTHQHDAVTQPFVDSDPDPRGHGAHRVAKRDELGHRLIVATGADEIGEPTEVEEGEGSLDAGSDEPMLSAYW
jgi:hypothetical protein